MPKPTNPSRDFVFTELSAELTALTAGQPFDGMTFGTFTDMHGQTVTIAEADFETYIRNTKAAIEATRSERGELAGLPIDARNHDKGDGGGWIIDLYREGNVLRFVPQWNSLGRELVGQKILRFFSPTIDLVNKVILGGTLTNWPATRNKQGQVLLRPIELSVGMFEIGGSMEGFAVIKVGEVEWKAPYTVDESGVVTFAPQSEWEQMEGESEPEMATEKPAEKLVEARAFAPATQEKKSMTNLAELSDTARAELQAQITDLVEAARNQVRAEFAAQQVKMQQENKAADLALRLTTGTPEAPRALKNVKPAELKANLLALPVDQFAYFAGVLEGVQKQGLQEFAELGHGKRVTGGQELPQVYHPHLKRAIESGNTVAQFFEAQGLGNPADYNLAAFTAKEK